MFSKILVANRGEIAVRIIRACKEMGILTVAIYSEADRDALHVSLADDSYCIGPPRLADSYLNMSAILTVATAAKAEAIHPGYGLLAENARFADLCEKCGIVFIGPSSDIIRRMGNKDAARKTMLEANIPVIPGSELLESEEDARKQAEQIGYPVLLKALAGGGGKGIRTIREQNDIAKTYEIARAEALSTFGDGGLYMEKFLSDVKHIEVQVLADNSGNIISLGERDCSVQRRNQKLLEESPAPSISDTLREKLSNAAVLAAAAVKYTGAGTIEFLVDSKENYYFIEMNTRLQVEHPVTEMVTGVDIVKWQIRIAAGILLNFRSDELKPKGHAIECRINSENPLKDFMPDCGRITFLHVPGGPWVRFDTAVYQDYTIPPFYDSMIGKLVVHARTREEAVRKMRSALCELVIEGVEHNSEFQIEILSSTEFDAGTYTTGFLSQTI